MRTRCPLPCWWPSPCWRGRARRARRSTATCLPRPAPSRCLRVDVSPTSAVSAARRHRSGNDQHERPAGPREGDDQRHRHGPRRGGGGRGRAPRAAGGHGAGRHGPRHQPGRHLVAAEHPRRSLPRAGLAGARPGPGGAGRLLPGREREQVGEPAAEPLRRAVGDGRHRPTPARDRPTRQPGGAGGGAVGRPAGRGAGHAGGRRHHAAVGFGRLAGAQREPGDHRPERPGPRARWCADDRHPAAGRHGRRPVLRPQAARLLECGFVEPSTTDPSVRTTPTTRRTTSTTR